ncbi:MAG: TonB-dependent receptor [Bacteroidota bacterium]
MKLNKIIMVMALFLYSFTASAAYMQNEVDDYSEKLHEDVGELADDGLIMESQFLSAQTKTNIRTSLNGLISLQYFNSNLKDIIKEICKNTKINFVYDDDLLDIEGININVEDKPLYEILDELLTPHNISYYEFEYARIALAKQIRIDENTGGITGTIKDEAGEKLVGANIRIVELGIGCAADLKGSYRIRNIKPGEYNVEVSFVGYEKNIKKVKIVAGQMIEVNFVLKSTSFLIGGIEVVGTSGLLPQEVQTKTTITSGEIEHYQASSLKDVLDLVPGVQKTDNPGLGKPTQIALRGSEANELSSFGTLVVVDGTPVSNNANLQFERYSSAYGGTSFGKGIDLRTIPADNIENIEIVTGLPSVRYGDVTSGVINVQTKLGTTPNRLKIKNNPDLKEGNLGGGISIGEGVLNYNFNVARSERDLRVEGDEYTRLTGQLIYSSNLFDNKLSMNNKIMVQKILDEVEPKGDLRQIKNYNRGYTVSLSTWGKYKPTDDVSSIDYNMYVTMRRENSMKSKLVTDYVILTSGDTLASYIGKVETKGIEWTFGGRLEWNKVFFTGDVAHKFLIGIDPQYNANTGEGMLLDTVLNYYGAGSGKRPYKYDDIPGQFLMNFYVEDKITSHFIFDYSLVVGFRYEMYRPYKFNLSGLWGDGDLVESHQGTFFNPRLNLMIYLSKENQIRLSAGTSSKSPPMSTIYPPEEVMPWRNPDDSTNYYFRYNRNSPDLKGYKETLFELAYDHKFFDQIGTSFSGYYKIRNNEPKSKTIPVFVASQTNNTYRVYYIDSYSMPVNIGKTETKGLEFSLRTSKIKELNMDFQLSGSFNYIKYFGRGYSYSSTPDESVGQYPNFSIPNVPTDTLIGWLYPSGGNWQEYFQMNYLVRYTHPTLGLWITLRAEQVVYEKSQDLNYAPQDVTLLNETELADYNFNRRIRRKPNKWLFNFSMSKSLFKGAEVSIYVNNFLDDPAVYRYNSSVNEEWEDERNPDLFYGIEFSMEFGNLFGK